jgi:hypothetical protein
MGMLRFTKTASVCIILYLFLSCGQKINEQDIITEIENWWGIEEIEKIVIDDITQEGNKAKVLARLIVVGDTTKRVTYEFEKFDKGWRLVGDPVDPFLRMQLAEFIPQKKLAELKNNMHTLQLVVEDFSTMTMGLYPGDFSIKIKELAKESRGEYDEYTIITLLPSSMVNPYNPDELPVITEKGTPSQWLPEYIGKAVYFPVGKKGNSATGYLIKGSSEYRFIDYELTSY